MIMENMTMTTATAMPTLMDMLTTKSTPTSINTLLMMARSN